MSYPDHLRYTKDHEWAELVSDTRIRVGITDHAQSSLGDIVFLELPKVGRELKSHETFGVVESIKAVSDLYAPVSGTVVQANADLAGEPGRINSNPHTEWMLVIESADAKAQYNGLMDAKAYSDFVRSL
ncbi:MAG: glycine cleavage system protein GcvH [Proteobacteria bacterium]|nr:glycine cleavage system protein GcvH [Pseudomonadota bacterium]